VGFVRDGGPVVIPTIHDRQGDTLYFHGSRSASMLHAMTSPAGACVTATLFDGMVLARSVFMHTMNYRSAVAFGHPEEVTDAGEKLAVLGHFTEHVLPGRTTEARAPTERELGLTTVVRMRIEEASAKVDDGPPEDEPEDMDLPVWAGIVPASLTWGEPIADSTGAVGALSLPLPPSVLRLLGRSLP
jgi:hypothetical protein